MRFSAPLRLAVLVSAAAGLLLAQAPPRLMLPPDQGPPQQQPAPQPAPASPQAQPAKPQVNTQAVVQGGAAAPSLTSSRGFLLGGVSLTEMIDVLARMMKISYILDPRVKGAVTIYTYGEVKDVDLMPLLQTILRVNNATIVKVGELYHVIPINTISQLPVEPVINADPKTLPEDERMILNMIFLKYATAAEMDKLLKPFYGEGATSSTYEPANLLILQDNSRSMKRTMELLAMFDADTFAGQRVKLFEVENSRPTDLAKELESVFKAYALSEKGGSVKFLPVDRINTLIAVAPNPGIFNDVSKWIERLDVAVKSSAGAVNNYVYRLKYGNAGTVAMAIMALYSGNPMAMMALESMANSGGIGGGGGMGMGGYGMGGMGMGGYGMGGMGMGGYGMGGMGMGGYGMGGYGMGGYGMGGYGMGGYGMGGYGMGGYGMGYGGMGAFSEAPLQPMSTAGAGTAAQSGQTGQYLGTQAQQAAAQSAQRMPHVIPNPFDNTLLVQGTPQEWEQIRSLLRQLDVAPRQVLIDAKIYEVDLTDAFSSGVEAFLEKAGSGGGSSSGGTGGTGTVGTLTRALNVVSAGGGLTASAGALVLRSHELLGAVTLAESRSLSRVVSSPSIIATDSIPAVMTVGTSIPVLTSSGIAVTGASFNSVGQQQTGTTLAVLARVNSSGVVTLVINQNVSSPGPNTASNIDSPAISNKQITTQVTVQDGDTIAIGGSISESKNDLTAGIPLISRIPLLGSLFGQRSTSKARTELVVFMTPRVIYDTTQVNDASDEIRSHLKKLQKEMSRDLDK
jgi:general secretion pathway protein D